MSRKGIISVIGVVVATVATVAIAVTVVLSLGSGGSGGSGHSRQNAAQEKYDQYAFSGIDNWPYQRELLSWTAKHSQGQVPITITLAQQEKAGPSDPGWDSTGTTDTYYGTQTGNKITFQYKGDTVNGTIGPDRHLRLDHDLVRQTRNLTPEPVSQ
ncbi:hypothetical protein AB0L00_26075 [Actinoallomurus sp. NPDC052308]|uniref:hypothetical protein n=1 Tax=Actinoallomurus sp. NPDC052308 TaxID=3155530 RepID=UPI003417A3FF